MQRTVKNTLLERNGAVNFDLLSSRQTVQFQGCKQSAQGLDLEKNKFKKQTCNEFP